MTIKSRCLTFSIAIVMILSNLSNNYIASANSQASDNKNIANYKNKLDNLIPKYLKKYNITGASIGIVSDGKISYVLNYGYSDKKDKKAVNNDTVFQVGSISKSLAALGVMHLVDEGKISLDDPAEKYLTRWHLPPSKYSKNDVTIKRLLSHTAGLSLHGYSGMSPNEKLPTLEESLSGKTDGAGDVHIESKPGSIYSYSGGGYTVLQLVIEEVTKMSFDKYMEEEILKPLGMSNSSYSNDFKNVEMSKAYGVLGQQLPNYNYTEEAAAGLKTTMADFLKYIIADMDGCNVVKTDSLDLMHTTVMSNYGLGCCISKLSNKNTLIWHGGTNRGWRANYAFIPETKDGIVIFTNSDNGQDLIDDVYDYWEEYETGYMPDQYYSTSKMRSITLAIAIVIGILLVAYCILFVFRIKNEKVAFFYKRENVSIIKMCFKLAIPLLIGGVWWFFFYSTVIFNGWNAAEYMPYGFKRITFLVTAWSIAFFITGFFVKTGKTDIKLKPSIANIKIVK